MFGPMAIDYTKLQSKVNVKFFFVNSHETSREFSIYAQNYVDETIALKLFKHDWHTNGRISKQHRKFQQLKYVLLISKTISKTIAYFLVKMNTYTLFKP